MLRTLETIRRSHPEFAGWKRQRATSGMLRGLGFDPVDGPGSSGLPCGLAVFHFVALRVARQGPYPPGRPRETVEAKLLNCCACPSAITLPVSCRVPLVFTPTIIHAKAQLSLQQKNWKSGMLRIRGASKHRRSPSTMLLSPCFPAPPGTRHFVEKRSEECCASAGLLTRTVSHAKLCRLEDPADGQARARAAGRVFRPDPATTQAIRNALIIPPGGPLDVGN